VAGRVQTAFDDRAARELRTSIRNFAELSNVLAQTVRAQSENLTTMSASVRAGVEALVAASADVKTVAARVDSSTERGEVKKIVEDAGEAARELRETSRRLTAISVQLGESQGRLQSMLVAGDSVMSRINRGQGSLGLLINDPSLYRSSDSLVREIQALVADLRRNPKRYVNVRIF
jgi:phospholipid/cholesterol/gamma-HCH transport system substrate-binding protein